MTKNLGSGPILAHLAQIWAANTFFSKIFKKNSSVTRYHGQLSWYTISENTNDTILTKRSDGCADGQIDGQTGKSDFMRRCRLTLSVQNQKSSEIQLIFFGTETGKKIFPKTIA